MKGMQAVDRKFVVALGAYRRHGILSATKI